MGPERVAEWSKPLPHNQVAVGERDGDVSVVVADLYDRMRPSLVSYAYRLVGSAADAEDAVQTAFLKVFDELNRKAAILNLKSWLYRVVHNLAVEQVRRAGKREWLIARWLCASAASPQAESAEDDFVRRQQIEAALERLNERERHSLLLRAEGLSYKEIADVLDISAKAVSVYLARGLKKLGAEHDAR
jgi:RNA polymerase sigma-70 factor (ECF subfamily)